MKIRCGSTWCPSSVEREREFPVFRGLHGPEVTVSSQPVHREDKAPGVNLINRINFTGTVIRRTFTFLRAKANGRRLVGEGEGEGGCDIEQMWNSRGDLRKWPRSRLTRANVRCLLVRRNTVVDSRQERTRFFKIISFLIKIK